MAPTAKDETNGQDSQGSETSRCAGPEWVIAGKPKGSVPEVGKVYEVRHSRKGTFKMRATALNDYWLTGVIVDGVAKAILSYNVAYEGDEVTVRNTMSYLIEVPGTDGGAP